MSLTKNQNDWLTKLGAAARVQGRLEDRQQKKDALLSKIANAREELEQKIVGGTDLTMKDKDGKKQATLDKKTHDQVKEAELDDQKRGNRLATKDGKKVEEWDEKTGQQEQFQKHLEAARAIDEMALELESELVEKLDKNGKPVKPREMVPLFEDDEIAGELYDPMIRRGMLPETNVPDKYSRTKEMLDGSFEAYAERLKEEGPKGMFADNLKTGMTLMTSMVSVTGTGFKFNEIAHHQWDSLQLKGSPAANIHQIQKKLGMIHEAATGDGASSAADAASSASDTATTGSDAAAHAADTLGTAADAAGEAEEELPKSVEMAGQIFEFSAQGWELLNDVVYEDGEDVYEWYTEAEKQKAENAKQAVEISDPEGSERKKRAVRIASILVAGMASQLGKAFEAAELGIAGSSVFGANVKTGDFVKELGAKSFGEKNAKNISKLLAKGCEDVLNAVDPKTAESGKAIPAAIKAITASLDKSPDAKAVATAYTGGKFDAIVSLFAKASEDAVKAADIKTWAPTVFKTDDDKRNARSKAGEVMDQALKKDEKKDKEPPAEIAAKHKPSKGHDPAWMKLGGEWVCTTCVTGDKDAKLFAGILDRKIAILQRDQRILKWGSSIAAMSFSVASNFIAPLTIAGSAVKMMKNLIDAIGRTRDFIAFSEKRDGLFNAASAYCQAAKQFVHNSEVQMLHYMVNTAAEGVKVIGGIVQCFGGVAAGAGAGLVASANAAQAIEAVIYELNRRYDLEMAWHFYAVALDQPDNRKAGLEAVKKNSTLAKYAVAWGAVIKKDGLVTDFLQACDLNADSLRDPKANVHKVVSYLEARMPDDNIVVGRMVPGSSLAWAPKTIELTSASWITAKARGEAKAGVNPYDTREIENGLKELSEKYDAWKNAAGTKPASTLDQNDLDACKQLLQGIRKSMGMYAPAKTKEAGGGIHVEMAQLRDRFQSMVAEREKTVNGWKAKPNGTGAGAKPGAQAKPTS